MAKVRGKQFATKAGKGSKVVTPCKDGPWKDVLLALSPESGTATGWILVGGVEGRYIGGFWETWAEYAKQQAHHREQERRRDRAKWDRYAQREAA